MKEKGRKILNYIKFTKKELENYVSDTTSCIEKVNNTIHMGFPPYGMADFKNTLLDIINKKIIGFFDERLNGIVLDAKNIKVLSTQWPIYNDSPELHIDVNADFYVFKPQIGATITGMVNHVTKTHIGVIIYRVFNVSIRLTDGHQDDYDHTEIKFTVKKFDLQNHLPYIEGILISDEKSRKKIFDEDSDNENDNTDSGISTEINDDKKCVKIKKFDSESDSENDTSMQHQQKKSVSFNLSRNKFRSPSPYVKQERLSSNSSADSTSGILPFENSFSDLLNEFNEPELKKTKKIKKKKSKFSLDTSNLLAETLAEKTGSPIKITKQKKSRSPSTTAPNIDDLISNLCSSIKEEKMSDSDTPKSKSKKRTNRKSFDIKDNLTEILVDLKKEPSKEEQDTVEADIKRKKRKAEESLSELDDSSSKRPKKKIKRKSILDELSSALFAELQDPSKE